MLVRYDKKRKAYFPLSFSAKAAAILLLLSYLLLWVRDVSMQRHLIRHEQLIKASLQMASDLTGIVNNKHVTPPIQKKGNKP